MTSRPLGALALLIAASLGCAGSESAPQLPAAPIASLTAPPAPPPPPSSTEVEAIVEARVPALLEACVTGKLDGAARVRLLDHVTKTRDPRGEACVIHALEGYRPDTNEDELAAATRAVGALALTSAREPLFKAFLDVHASRPKGSRVYRAVHDTLLGVLDPSWEGRLLGLIERPTNPRDTGPHTDDMFWQVTAIESLGRLRSAKAVRPLLKVLLSPTKAVGQMDAVMSLLRIGKPSVVGAGALLRGDDAELVAYAKSEAALSEKRDGPAGFDLATAHVSAAAVALGALGRADGAALLIDELRKTTSPIARALIARELAKVPSSPEALKAFQAAFVKVPTTLKLPASRSACEALLEASTGFLDASLVPWMLTTVTRLKGNEDDLEPIREAALIASLKLATRSQLKLIDQLAAIRGSDGTVGKAFTKEITQARDLLDHCVDRVDCYLGRLVDPELQRPAQQFSGIKAAYMIGVLGGTPDARKLVDALPAVTNPAVRFAAITAIDHLLPKGDAAVAAALQKLIDAAVGDPARTMLNRPSRAVILRLETRAGG